MVKELIPRPLPAKARLHLALEENANLRTRIAALEAKLAARTGGVKVGVLVDGLLDLRDLIMRGKRCVTDSGPAVKPVIELAVVHILDDAAIALEALSPAPEAQQEPPQAAMEARE